MKLFAYLLLAGFISFNCVQPVAPEGNVSGNQNPVIQSIIADPLFIPVGATSRIIVQAEDPDGDLLSYSWSAPIGDIIGSGADILYTASFCCVGINRIQVTVKDSRGGTITGFVDVEITGP